MIGQAQIRFPNGFLAEVDLDIFTDEDSVLAEAVKLANENDDEANYTIEDGVVVGIYLINDTFALSINDGIDLFELLDNAEDDEVAEAFLDYMVYNNNVSEAGFHDAEDSFDKIYDNVREYAKENTDTGDIDPVVMNHIDWDGVADDMLSDYVVIDTCYGNVAVFSS
jgi:hypothetical protein